MNLGRSTTTLIYGNEMTWSCAPPPCPQHSKLARTVWHNIPLISLSGVQGLAEQLDGVVLPPHPEKPGQTFSSIIYVHSKIFLSFSEVYVATNVLWYVNDRYHTLHIIRKQCTNSYEIVRRESSHDYQVKRVQNPPTHRISWRMAPLSSSQKPPKWVWTAGSPPCLWPVVRPSTRYD